MSCPWRYNQTTQSWECVDHGAEGCPECTRLPWYFSADAGLWLCTAHQAAECAHCAEQTVQTYVLAGDQDGSASLQIDEAGLGRFRTVRAREAVGGDEPSHFTPWLARHIEVLGEAIGLSIRALQTGEEELVAGQHIEVAVGNYFLDIKATDSEGRIVAVENQYGMADHKHLGQVMTYASGVGADVLVWVAEAFSDAHLQAVRWLNERTDRNCGVFAVRARFLQIGDSPAAPAFELLAGPSEWARSQRRSRTEERESWTKDRLLESLRDPIDVSRVAELFDWNDATERRGQHASVWFGIYPNGSVFLHPHGYRYPPFAISVNGQGRATVYGLWSWFPSATGRPGWRHIAEALGQSDLTKSPGFALADLDLDQVWKAALLTAREVNEFQP